MNPTRITAGALQNLHLSEIAQMLSLGGKTACVTVSANGREGRVWFHEGTVAHARLGDERGEEAFYELLGWRSGRFFIEHGMTTERRTIDKDTMYLLMEGLRRGDEAAGGADEPADATRPTDRAERAWPFDWLFETGERTDRAAAAAGERSAFLEVRTTSRIRGGRLILLLDGAEVRRRDLAVPERRSMRLLSWITGSGATIFEERLPVAPGAHVMAARLVRSDETCVESAIDVDLRPGQVAAHRLYVGRAPGKDVVWHDAAGGGSHGSAP